jgi:hypothetical protein
MVTGFVTRLTRRVSLVEQELLTRPEHLSSTPVFSGVRVNRSLIFMYFLLIVVCSFVLFLLAIVLSVLLRHTDSGYLPLVSSNSSSYKILHRKLKLEQTLTSLQNHGRTRVFWMDINYFPIFHNHSGKYPNASRQVKH